VRVGNVLEYKGKLVVVRRAQAVKPGKGGAFNQVELKDIRTGTKYHERLRASESVERVRLDDEEEYDFLYRCVRDRKEGG
jgi:elongation factor P